MKPDWDKLMKEYADHASILIADVDCTAEGKDLCETHGIQGFPSIKYGDPNSLEDYEGGRDLAALQTFAKDNLGPRCGPANLDLCDAENKKKIEGFMAMPVADLKEAVEGKEAEMKAADEELDTLLKSLQSQFEEGQKKRDNAKKAIKEAGLGLMKSVQAHRKSEKSEL